MKTQRNFLKHHPHTASNNERTLSPGDTREKDGLLEGELSTD